ncbi:MAG: hypothetical protein DHS80DRAFT_25903 [Piptocephalis tieghemiana]|nr:MAG: hypothetical protein DHS80DRAFT_25903 [Piptocephalis tieghemiana]
MLYRVSTLLPVIGLFLTWASIDAFVGLGVQAQVVTPATTRGNVTLDAWEESCLIRLLNQIHANPKTVGTQSPQGRVVYAEWNAVNKAYMCMKESYQPGYQACKDTVSDAVFSFPPQCMASPDAISNPDDLPVGYNLNRPLTRRAASYASNPSCTYVTVKCVHPDLVPTTQDALRSRIASIEGSTPKGGFSPTEVLFAPRSIVEGAGHQCVEDGSGSLTATVGRVTVECIAG